MKRSFRIDHVSTSFGRVLLQEWVFRTKSVAIVTLFACLFTSCSWTPQVETVLHNTPQALVSLRTVSDETFRTSHPIDISDTIIMGLLEGLQKQEQVRLLQTLVTGNPQPVPIFFPSQVTYLAPLIKNAFEQATHEEEVYFRLPNAEATIEPIEGSIFVYGPNIVFAIKSAPPRGTSKKTQSTKSYDSGSPSSSHRITFTPQEAMNMDDVSHIPYIHKLRKNSVLIHYQKIDAHKLHKKDGSVNIMNTPVAPHTPTSSPPPVASEPQPSSNQTTEITTPFSTPLQQLQEQMKILEEQLGEQKAEIERLKKLQR